MEALGPFYFSGPIEDGVKREKSGLVLLESGAKYEGEWIEGTNIRDGRGV